MASATELRAYAVELMKSRTKKNSYTQGGKRTYFYGYPDNEPGNTTQSGYSDCSAAVRAVIKTVTGVDIGSNTSAQINNRNKKGIVVDETTEFYPDESKLLPGDCLYFKGNTSHPLDVGHVEMYTGSNECYGHGSGTGPTKKNLKSYCKSRATSKKRYFMAIRWIKDDDSPTYEKPVLLQNGMNDNADVKLLQLNLISLGYDLGKYGADGDFGSATESAVKAFQKDSGLNPTGIVYAETQAAIAAALEALGDTDETDTLPVPILDGVTIASGSWNVRTGPGTEFAAAGVVKGGDRLEKIDLDGWTPVLYNGEVCFIGPSAVRG